MFIWRIYNKYVELKEKKALHNQQKAFTQPILNPSQTNGRGFTDLWCHVSANAGKGAFNCDSFLGLMALYLERTKNQDAELRAAFKVFDKDAKGYIDWNTLKYVNCLKYLSKCYLFICVYYMCSVWNYLGGPVLTWLNLVGAWKRKLI